MGSNTGSVPNDSNGYDEPDRSTGNRSFTDYAQDDRINETGRRIFRDRRKPKESK